LHWAKAEETSGFFALFPKTFMGIILSMFFPSFKKPFLVKVVLFSLLLQGSGLMVPLFIPKAHALYWEDETDSNDPKEVKRRPDHFLLFDWLGNAEKDMKKAEYRDKDNRDKGPGVNSGSKAMVVIASALVGLGLGLVVGNFATEDQGDLTSNLFIGGALGLCAGVAVGALIIPADYETNRRAQIDFMKQRQAWMQDPIRLQIAQAFQPSQVSLQFKF
jgi:hypothetical protein